MARVCVFDVNETLLDLGALDPHFERVSGDAGVRRAWFLQLLQSALVATVTGAYSDFGQVGAAALEIVAEREGVDVSAQDRQKILGGMQEVPPHPEVAKSLDRLRDAGLRLATLTNSTRQVAEAQRENSELRGYFEQILSAGDVKRLKRAPEPYRMAAESLGVEMEGVRLVAAHAWDVAGGLRARRAAALAGRSRGGVGPPAGRAPGGGARPGGGE